MKKLFYFALVLSCGIMLSSCGTSKEITFKGMENVKFKSVGTDGKVKVTADAVMHNPRRPGAKLTYTECDVFLEGKKIAEVAQLRELKVPGRSDFSVPLETTVSLQSVLGNSFKLMKKAWSDGTVNVKLDGAVKVKALGKTFTVPFISEEETPLR